jgi:hypothetical protein
VCVPTYSLYDVVPSFNVTRFVFASTPAECRRYLDASHRRPVACFSSLDSHASSIPASEACGTRSYCGRTAGTETGGQGGRGVREVPTRGFERGRRGGGGGGSRHARVAHLRVEHYVDIVFADPCARDRGSRGTDVSATMRGWGRRATRGGSANDGSRVGARDATHRSSRDRRTSPRRRT